MKQTVKFDFKATYYQSAEITESTEEIWFVLHGYGQLPEYFIRKFQKIATNDRVIIAPGGLSKFYMEGFSGRVGATWMTKEERLIDIENYIQYLNQVAETVFNQLQNIPKVTLLGFSQGSATVCRWLNQFKHPFKALVLHSGAFPPDIDFSGLHDRLKGKQVFMITGMQDEFVNEKREAEQQKIIQQLNVPIQHMSFAGGHDIDINSLQTIIQQIK